MTLLDAIPKVAFESVGSVIGLIGVAVIAVQLRAEWKSSERSSLSLGYICGFLIIYTFWTLYGLRFRLLAISGSNLIAALLQTALLYLVYRKNTLCRGAEKTSSPNS